MFQQKADRTQIVDCEERRLKRERRVEGYGGMRLRIEKTGEKRKLMRNWKSVSSSLGTGTRLGEGLPVVSRRESGGRRGGGGLAQGREWDGWDGWERFQGTRHDMTGQGGKAKGERGQGEGEGECECEYDGDQDKGRVPVRGSA